MRLFFGRVMHMIRLWEVYFFYYNINNNSTHSHTTHRTVQLEMKETGKRTPRQGPKQYGLSVSSFHEHIVRMCECKRERS